MSCCGNMHPMTKINHFVMNININISIVKFYRMDWCWIAKPWIVHFFDIGWARSIEERFSSGWVVWFDTSCGDKIICNLESRSMENFCYLLSSDRVQVQVIWDMLPNDSSIFLSFRVIRNTHFRFLLTHQPRAKILLSWWCQEIESGSSTMHFYLLSLLLLLS